MRVARVVVCAVAVLGAFLLVLRVAWLAGYEPTWLPYLAHAVGGVIAGAVIARQGPFPRTDAVLGGILGVAMLAAVAFISPRTFGWIAVRSSQPSLTAAAIAFGTGATTSLGAWLGGSAPRAGALSIVMLSTCTAMCLVLFGTRVAGTLLGTEGTTWMVIETSLLAFVAGFATQSIVSTERLVACASGVAVLFGVQVLGSALKSQVDFKIDTFLLLAPILVGLIGARAGWALRPRAESSLAAFD